MTYTSYAELNALGEFPMIAGTDWILTFTCYQSDGTTLQDIGGATIYWNLCPFGNTDYNVLQISGVPVDQYSFTVTIPAASTETLNGKFTHQTTVDSFFGQRYRAAQGIILILPRIPLN